MASDIRKEDWGQIARAQNTCEQRGASKAFEMTWMVEVLEGKGASMRVGSLAL